MYLAEDAVLARPVAIKVIDNLSPGARQRFLQEARAAAKIQHPNVVGIYRVGTYDSWPYLVTELVRGAPLSSMDKPMAWPAVLDIAIGMARGLAAAHRRNVVHCDLKPSNVMVDADGVVKIIDFGLARIVADGASVSHGPVGTPEYMAPEVWRGEAPRARSDIFSFGVVLFELLTGAPPFSDVETAALSHRVTTSDAPSLRERAPDVDPSLIEIVARCLRRAPTARFADGDELREVLERLHASRRHTARAGENPYRGLLPFEANHRGVFFGRRSEIDEVVARLRFEPIVLVTGDSGVGKSSLCRAGVVPAVADGELGDGWQALSFVPGHRPLTALAAAAGEPALADRLRDNPAALPHELRRRAGGRGLIVFVDQLEELITLGDPAEVAVLDAGFQALSEGVDGVRLLATARADFLARISNLPGLGRDLARTLYFLRPLPPERLRDVIVGPAEAVGVRFESDAIVDELVAATAQTGSGGLPLLSFALADLWEARDRERDMITRSAVAEMGGVAGALSRHADVVIGGMVAGRRDARRVLLRLVSAMGTRARRSASELALGDSGRSALDALVSGRLVVVHDSEPEPVYELAHECLITGWTKLREWLDADAARRGTRERLAAAAAEWLRLGRRSDATWQGKRLDEAAALEPESLSGDDLAFLAASQHARRWRRRLRWLAAIGVIALVALAFATQRYIARRELTAAVAEELTPAGEALGKARAASRELNRLEWAAFQKFDAANSSAEKRKDAEAAWKEVVALRQDADRAYREAGQYVEIALAKDPTRSDVRDRLGDILIERATLAEHVRDLALRDELIGRLEPYDADGSRRALWNAHGTLVVRVPATAQVKLESTRPPVSLRSVPLAGGVASESLAPGSYVVVVSAPGHAVVRAPVVIERGGEFDLAIAPPRAADVPDGYVYIPRGKFLFGHANEIDRKTFFNTTPLRPRETEAFLIGRTEITFAEWLAWIDSLPPDEQTARLPSVPDRLSGSIKLTADATGHWRIELQPVTDVYTAGWDERIVYRGRDRRIAQDWRKFPVTGISADDAAAYAAWLAQTGRLPGARLCSEVEWERAARGADDRAYPGGGTPELDDINVDDTYGQALRGPDEVGSHPASNSPFGLEDMSGNALECTVGEDGGFILRGGGYWYDRKSAQVTNRAPFDRIVREASLGLRLCATPTPALPE